MTLVYLDVCCLNRPFDDQSQGRVKLEAEAVLLILSQVERGNFRWASSEAVIHEIRQIRDSDRRQRLLQSITLAGETVEITSEIQCRATELVRLGFGAMDSLHLACAETAECLIFLITDDRLLKRASDCRRKIRVLVKNPLTWAQGMFDYSA